jgi:Xaa-Pro aminopeptidase
MSTPREQGYAIQRDAMREYYPRFSETEYQRRYGLLRGLMDAQGLDCILLYGDSGCGFLNQLAVHWVSNYIDEMYSYVVFPREGEPTVWCSVPPDQAAAMACSVLDDVRAGGMSMAMASRVRDRLAKELRLDGKRIGIVDNFAIAPALPHAHYQLFTEAMVKADLLNVTKEFEKLRAVPSDEEMEWFRKGIELTDLAWEALVEAAEPGRTEAELWGAVHSSYLSRGGSFCFCILGSTPMDKPVMSYPHGISNLGATRKVQEGDIVLAEISGCYYGYSGQCFCAVALGKPSEQIRRMYDYASDLYEELCGIVKPGATEQDVLAVGRRVAADGYDIEAPFVHAWGTHFGIPAIGMENWGDDPVEFVEGQFIVVEPNPCTPDTLVGLQVGNMTRVGKDGCVQIHRHGTELTIK